MPSGPRLAEDPRRGQGAGGRLHPGGAPPRSEPAGRGRPAFSGGGTAEPAAIAQELSSQYSIAYSPANSRLDGRFRRIMVRVSTRPELRLRTRGLPAASS